MKILITINLTYLRGEQLVMNIKYMFK